MFETKQKILDVINNSGLPLEAMVFILKDIYRDAIESLESMKQEQTTKEE